MSAIYSDPIYAVISDWCGTIESNVVSRITAIQFCCQKMNLCPLSAEDCQQISGMTQQYAFEYLSTLNNLEIDKNQFTKYYNHHRQQHQTQLILNTETKEWLMQHTVFCLFTNGSRAYVSNNIKKYALDDCFQQIATADEFPAKPSPAMLEFITKEISIPAKNCLIVGDHPYDLLAAHAAQAPCVIVETGISSRDDFTNLPEAIAHVGTINDVPRLIQSINAENTER